MTILYYQWKPARAGNLGSGSEVVFLVAKIRQIIRTNLQHGSRFLLEKGIMKAHRGLERWLKVLAEDPGSVPTTHMMAHNHS